jgi:antitoxin component of RelBE/YafQ-DinJ toxin-antitoxin module|tara:strand:+ start:1113 stop:1265 length:153 start_codon:yes stop_codon:yes gene_type:complete
MKRGNDKLTLSVDRKIKDEYKQVCEEEGLMLSKQIEKFMLNELKKRGKAK